jgi:hypothetical protein
LFHLTKGEKHMIDLNEYPLDSIKKEAAEMADAAQSACNLSGVVKSWGRMLSELWDYANAHNKGTEWVNQHPLNIAFYSKIGSLARIKGINDELDAIGWIMQAAKLKPVPEPAVVA